MQQLKYIFEIFRLVDFVQGEKFLFWFPDLIYKAASD